jgi:curved DNA-binding protein CbpA
MNIQKACIILHIDHTNITPENIKKQYRYYALLYHPDKNKSEYATKQFQEINEAYRFLSDISDTEETTPTYKTLLKEFIKHLFQDDETENDKKYDYIITNITNRISKLFSEDKIIEFIERLEYKYILFIQTLFTKYKDIFYFSDSFYETIEYLLEKKKNNDSDLFVLLTPTLDDLFENNCYKLVYQDSTFIIPLWQHELIYDTPQGELCVQCAPILPNNIEMDEDNHMQINVSLNVIELLEKETFTINLGNTRTLDIPVSFLSIKKKQQITLKHQGISMNDVNDIYNISVKSDIILNICMF